MGRHKIVNFVDARFESANSHLSAHRDRMDCYEVTSISASVVDKALLATYGIEKAIFGRALELVTPTDQLSETMQKTRGL